MNESQNQNPETGAGMPVNPTPKKSGLATAGLVLGIIALVTAFIPIVNNASFFMGILAAIFGLIPLFKKASVGKAAAALILGVLAIVMTLVMQSVYSKAINDAVDEATKDLSYMMGDKTDEILDEYLDVSIGSFQVTEGEYFTETQLTVTVKNKGTERKSFDLQIEAVAKDGTRIDTDSIYVSDLGAGQKQTFKIFTLVSSEDIAALKQASFQIVEASMY